MNIWNNSFTHLEGIEKSVVYRGRTEITNRMVTIRLPSHIAQSGTDFTVQITPIIRRNQTPRSYTKIYVATNVDVNKYTGDLEFDVFGDVGFFDWLLIGKKI
jgi:hypothetical protein